MRNRIAWILIVCYVGCSPASAERTAAQGTDSAPDAHPTASATGPRIADEGEVVARGIEIYREQLCGICHRFEKAETRGVFGPPHDGFPAVALERIQTSSYTGSASTPAEYIRESIVDPKAYLVPGYESGFHQMPPYVDLAPEDLEALVQLLLLDD